MRKNAHVYVLSGKDGLVKIGHSTNVDARVAAIENFAAVEYVSPVLENAEMIERAAHRLLKFRGEHVRGEWFNVSVRAAIEAVKRAEPIGNGEEFDFREPPKTERVQIGIKLPPYLIDAIDDWRLGQEFPPTRTEVIEAAIDAWLTARNANSRKGKAA